MSEPPELPDLALLSSAEKDRLIVTLYQTLLAVEGRAQLPHERQVDPARVGELKSRITASAPSRRLQSPPSKSSAGLFRYRPLQIAVVLLSLGFVADLAIGWYQRTLLERERRPLLVLRSAAFDGLYVELVRVAYEPGGRGYRATMTMQNSHADAPLFIMMNPVRVFVQVGRTWQEVPAEAPPGVGWGVVELADSRDVSVVFQAEIKDWAELIPGYMHVRIDSQMLISRRETPTSDIVERNNVFYVYLKPQNADDETIKRKAHFPGKPPVFIPMPPH